MYESGDMRLQCALNVKHANGHRDGYPLRSQPAQNVWFAYNEFAKMSIVVVPASWEHGRASLTYSTRSDVDYQLTFWTDEMPTGHLDLSDFDEAMRELWTAASPKTRQEWGGE